MRSLEKAKLYLCPNVKVLRLSGCKLLEEIDLQEMDSLISVEVFECDNLGKELVKTRVEKLRDLVLSRWTGICYPASFLSVLSSLTALQGLHIVGDGYKSQLDFSPNLSGCINLRKLTLSPHPKMKTFPDVSNLTNLKTIDFSCCRRASNHSSSSNLSKLFESMSSLRNLQDLNLEGCWGFNDGTGLGELISLQKLDVSETSISELPNLRKLKQLQFLKVTLCRSLKSLVGIAEATALRYLNAQRCSHMRELSDQLSSLLELDVADLSNSGICTLPNGYKMLVERGILKMSGCWGLIVPLMKELQRQVLQRSHECVSIGCVSSCEQSMWDKWKDSTTYYLLRDVVSKSCSCLLNYGEQDEFTHHLHLEL